jgi:pSer/pThr/pTyr-binding forkhead associated (FHA) protein
MGPASLDEPPMILSVTICLAEAGERSEELVDRRMFDLPEVTVGSAPGCTLQLAHPRVSPLHARFARGLEGYALIDEGSTEGTFVSGTPLRQNERRQVRGGDVVRLGPYQLELTVGPQPDGKASGSTFSLALALVDEAAGKAGVSAGPCIEVCAGPDRRRRLDLVNGQSFLLGRDRSADLPLAEPKASRHHVRVELRDGTFWVQDLGSSNGTLLGDDRLLPNKPVRWGAGVELRIGDDVLVCRNPWAEAIAELDRKAAELQNDRLSRSDSEHFAPPEFRPSQPTLTEVQAAPLSKDEGPPDEPSIMQCSSRSPEQVPKSIFPGGHQAPVTALPCATDGPISQAEQGGNRSAERRRWGTLEVLLVVALAFAASFLFLMIWVFFA